MGTPDFAVGILDALFTNDYTIVGVITAADKPAGRGKKLKESAVKAYAISHEIPVLQPKNLKNEDFLKELACLKADLQIIVAFRMLPKVVWDMPRLGTFNLHASLLPSYRGAAPINWAIINGETESGVTTFFIDDKIDTGEILLQVKTPIRSDETAGSLHDILMTLGAELVINTVELITKGDFVTQKQPEIAPTNAPKLYKNTCHINWDDSLINIYNKIRGLNPYPTAWSKFICDKDEYTLKIYKSHIEFSNHEYVNGSILSTKKSLKVAVKDGFLFLDEVQLSGKRKMDIKSLLNGFQFSSDAKMSW